MLVRPLVRTYRNNFKTTIKFELIEIASKLKLTIPDI